MAKRLQAMGVEQYKNGFRLTLAPHTLSMPYNWHKPKVVFVNSMSDLFHKDVPLDYIQKVFSVMNETPQHTYQVLTKRSDRLKEIAAVLPWTKNIWMGVSVENEKVSFRARDLVATPAMTKFLSIEPLIGWVNPKCLKGIDWVIVGGESGPGARPIEKEWVMELYRESRKQKIPFFFKQWGKKEFNADPLDPTMHKSHKFYAKGGCQLDGEVRRRMPV